MTVSLRQNLWLLHVTDGPVLMRVLFSSRAKKKKKKASPKIQIFLFKTPTQKHYCRKGLPALKHHQAKVALSVFYIKNKVQVMGFIDEHCLILYGGCVQHTHTHLIGAAVFIGFSSNDKKIPCTTGDSRAGDGFFHGGHLSPAVGE